MSGQSIAPYFPWCRMKVAYQSIAEESRSALVRLEPDRRYRPLCHACGQAARTVHSNTRKFVQDLSFWDCSMMLQVEHRKIWCDHCQGVRLEMNRRLNTVYWLKDFLAHIWDYCIPGWAEGALAEWCTMARQDGHPELVRFAKMLERHQYGIISHCNHRMHTSMLEGVNNKIKVIKRVAYGFHDLDYFALKVKQAFPGRISSN